MAIEDVFTISGRGTVVTGRVERGKIVGGRRGRDSRVLERHRRLLRRVLRMFQEDPGRRNSRETTLGVLLRGTGKDDVERGQVLSKPGSITPHKKFKAEVYVLKKEEGGRHTPFFPGYRPQFYLKDNGRYGLNQYSLTE